MPDFAAWTPADWSAFGALATVAIAIVAASVAVVQVRQARKLREEQAQPFIVVDFEPSTASSVLVDLVIKNTGQTLAENVRIRFSPPLVSAYFTRPSPTKYDIMEAAILKHGIPSMPPGKEFRILFDRMPERYTSDLPRSYDVVVRFASRRREEKPLTYRLDLDIFFGTQHVTIYGIHHAAKALDQIRRTLERWTAHNNGARVYAIDERKYEEELEAAYQVLRAEEAQIESVEKANSSFSPDLVVTDAAPTTTTSEDEADRRE